VNGYITAAPGIKAPARIRAEGDLEPGPSGLGSARVDRAAREGRQAARRSRPGGGLSDL